MKLFAKSGFVSLIVLAFLGCSPENGKLVPGTKPPPPAQPQRKTKSGATSDIPANVDILFMIDNSGSMGKHQRNLSTNISLFTDQLLANANVDYHVGVINSTDEEGMKSPIPGIPDVPGEPGGKLQGSVKVVTRTTPDAINILKSNLIVGVTGAGVEKFFVPGYKALTPPLVDNENAGFLRPEAYLAIVILTDTDDQSPLYDANGFKTFLLSLKGNNSAKILTYGGIIDNGDSCTREAGEFSPTRLREFFSITGGITFSLCSADFGAKLAGIAKDLVRRTASKILLDSVPDLGTVEVSFGSQKIFQDNTTGWFYNSAENSIDFGRGVVWSNQPTGTAVVVTYLDKQ